MHWLTGLKHHLKKTGELWVDRVHDRYHLFGKNEKLAIIRKKDLFKDRGAKIVKANTRARILGMQTYDYGRNVQYKRHIQWVIKQNNDFYIEEEVTERQATFVNGEMNADKPLREESGSDLANGHEVEEDEEMVAELRSKSKGYHYNRLQAVRYADRWWNAHNPEYRAFDVDCTNYVSQCLHAGGVPMVGHHNQQQGWWYGSGRWSLSWAVAHSMRWYLSAPGNLANAVAKESPESLLPGDIICYDFEGDGRWDHTTFVTAKDARGMPLVNAHTTDSRHRYWSYEDSTAYTDNIKYKFFHIQD